MPPLRLCVCVESTAKAGLAWKAAVASLLEPLLSMLEGPQHAGGCELALVLFGAHGGSSVAAVESSLTWCAGVLPFRALLAGLRFEGGGGQPVALADALLEAAALFACAGSGAPPPPQHCLVWLASDPATRPVPWPFADDCTVVRCGQAHCVRQLSSCLPLSPAACLPACPHHGRTVPWPCHLSQAAHPPPFKRPCVPLSQPPAPGAAAVPGHVGRAVPRAAAARHPAFAGGAAHAEQPTPAVAPAQPGQRHAAQVGGAGWVLLPRCLQEGADCVQCAV